MCIPQTIIAPPEWVAAQDPARWLTAQERARCDAAASARRRAERRAGRLAVKRLLLRDFDAAPLSYEVGTDGLAPVLVGWPAMPPITISLSHSAGLGAASWAWTESQGSVGVDAQCIRPAHPALAARVLTQTEQLQAAQAPDFVLLFWAIKEAAIKARRRAWGRALREIIVTLDAPGCDQGAARIALIGEADMAANYTREATWWIARAVQPLP